MKHVNKKTNSKFTNSKMFNHNKQCAAYLEADGYRLTTQKVGRCSLDRQHQSNVSEIIIASIITNIVSAMLLFQIELSVTEENQYK